MSAPEQIGPLRIERELGAGGMGEVYLARDARLERHVAVKLLPSSRSLDPEARGRMLREARAASALKHPGIVTVYDVGEHDGRSYIVMEFVDGQTFETLVARRGRLPADEAVALVAQVADAVAAAHDAGVLHRDLKAANLMIDASGRVKVLDFGLSKRTDAVSHASRPPSRRSEPPVDTDAATVAPDGSDDGANAATATPDPDTSSDGVRTDEPMTMHGARMGTPGWAPPELIDGRTASARSDVFALGCVLYHLLTGELPFPARGFTAMRAQIAAGAAPPSKQAPGIPRALDAAVLAALAEDPADRPDGARAFIDAARAAVTAPPAAGRGPIYAAAGATVLGAIAVVAIVARGHSPEAVATSIDAVPIDARYAGPAEPARLTHLRGCAYNPAFLDDDTVVFDLTRDGAVDLYTQPLSDGAPTQRTAATGWEWRSSRGATPDEVLYIEQTDGGGMTRRLDLVTKLDVEIAASAGPAVFAGGAYYHAPNGENQIHRVRGDRDDVFVATPAGKIIDTLAASPAGDRLAAMLSSRDSSPQLCGITIAPPTVRCGDEQIASGRPAFSSSGDALYVEVADGIARMPFGGGEPLLVEPGAHPAGGLAVSPSGRTLLWSDCRSRDELVDPLGDRTAPIVEDGAATFPTLGEDGGLAYVHVERDHQVLMGRDGRITRELMRADGGSFSGLAFSSKGSLLAFALDDPKAPGIYELRAAGGSGANRLTEDRRDAGPVFIGDEIVFTRVDSQGVPHLMRMGAEGGTPTLASKRPRITLDVDRARQRVLLTAPDRAYLYWWDPTTGVETAGPVLPQPDRAVDIALSPHGRWMSVLYGANGQHIYRVDLEAAAPSLDLATTLPEDLTTVAGAITDDGVLIISLRSWTGELWWTGAPAGTLW